MTYDQSDFDPHGHGHSGYGHWVRWMGRHRGGHGFGHFAAGFMGGAGRGGFQTGRKLGAADLQLLILALLAEKPSHGYELIKDLAERSGGFYSPSPGMIYPALTYLEEIGYATFEAEGTKKRYRLTEAGSRHLDENRALAEAMLGELARIGGKMEHVRRAFAGDAGDAGDEAGDEAEEERFGPRHSEELHAARHALRSALHQKGRCPPEEARRIAGILRRAAAEILGI